MGYHLPAEESVTGCGVNAYFKSITGPLYPIQSVGLTPKEVAYDISQTFQS